MLGILILGVSAGCEIPLPEEPRGEGPGHRGQRLGLRPDEELALGQQAYDEVLRQARGHILPGDDPQVPRVRSIASRIVRAAGIEPLQREIDLHVRGYRFEWECNVIRDRRINAFCLPGGKIAVFRGILPVAWRSLSSAWLIIIIGERTRYFTFTGVWARRSALHPDGVKAAGACAKPGLGGLGSEETLEWAAPTTGVAAFSTWRY
jgi:hypothetical protein